jgi:hypothetical protein
MLSDEERATLDFIHLNGKTLEQLGERFGESFDISSLLTGGYVERLEIASDERSGARFPPGSVEYYALTARGAEAIGLDASQLDW